MARYNRLQSSDSNRTQTSTQEGLDAVERDNLGPASRNGAPQSSNGYQTSLRSVKKDQPTLIPHKLGRAFRGWNVASKDQPQSFFSPKGAPRYDKSKYICVQWNDPGGITYTSIDAEFWVY